MQIKGHAICINSSSLAVDRLLFGIRWTLFAWSWRLTCWVAVRRAELLTDSFIKTWENLEQRLPWLATLMQLPSRLMQLITQKCNWITTLSIYQYLQKALLIRSELIILRATPSAARLFWLLAPREPEWTQGCPKHDLHRFWTDIGTLVY